MARRSDNTREELKEMAVSEGVALLEEGGVQALSARSIAQRMGYTVGTLYNVFADLEDIILHLNAATIREMYDAMAPLAHSKKPPAQRMVAIARAYGTYAVAHPARWHLLHGYPRTRPLPDWFDAEAGRVFILVEEVLLAKGLSKKAAHDAARVLWAGLHGICSLSLSAKLNAVDARPIYVLIENFVTHYLKGFD